MTDGHRARWLPTFDAKQLMADDASRPAAVDDRRRVSSAGENEISAGPRMGKLDCGERSTRPIRDD